MSWEDGNHEAQVAHQKAEDLARLRLQRAEKRLRIVTSAYIWVPIALATGLFGLTTTVPLSWAVVCGVLWLWKEYRKGVYDKAVEDNRF